MSVASAVLALSVSYWPTHWLPKDQEGVLEVEYRVTRKCGIGIVAFSATPDTLSLDGVQEILKNYYMRRDREIDLESVYETVPGLNIGDVHTNEQYSQVEKTVEKLGPWAETRTILTKETTVVCEITAGGVIKKVTYSGKVLDGESLSSIPHAKIKLRYKQEGVENGL